MSANHNFDQTALACGALNIIEWYLSCDANVVECAVGDSFRDATGGLEYVSRYFGVADGEYHCGSNTDVRCQHILKNLFQRIFQEISLKEDRLAPWGVVGAAMNLQDEVKWNASTGRNTQQTRALALSAAYCFTEELLVNYADAFNKERIRYAMKVDCIENISLFWLFLGKADLDLACVEAEALRNRGETLLAYCVSLLIPPDNEVDDQQRRSQWYTNHIRQNCQCSFDEGYIKLVRQAFELGDLKRSFDRSGSPLLLLTTLVADLFWVGHESSSREIRAIESRVRQWLMVISKAGIDIDQYGRQEHEYFTINPGYEVTSALLDYYGCHIRLINFSWGKTPDDWKFWWSTSMDEINNTFLLHHVVYTENKPEAPEPDLHIPGAWVDTCEEDTDNDLRESLYRIAKSRRRRKRYLTAAGVDMHSARDVFGSLAFHGWKWRPKVPRKDCLLHCSEWSRCRKR